MFLSGQSVFSQWCVRHGGWTSQGGAKSGDGHLMLHNAPLPANQSSANPGHAHLMPDRSPCHKTFPSSSTCFIISQFLFHCWNGCVLLSFLRSIFFDPPPNKISIPSSSYPLSPVSKRRSSNPSFRWFSGNCRTERSARCVCRRFAPLGEVVSLTNVPYPPNRCSLMHGVSISQLRLRLPSV